MAKTIAELEAQLAEALARLADASKVKPISYKVGAKGGLSVYGINNPWPVTLYVEQWERLDTDEERDRRRAFAAKNATALVRKSKAAA